MDSNGANVQLYTGVVIVHGIGNERRNETLQEAVDALSYWFNHVAGLSLRPEGPGRIWLQTELTEDVDPDAPASRATLELAAPSTSAAIEGGPTTLRLELREAWWAESFGTPTLGSVLRWARIQFREEVTHLLLPNRATQPARGEVSQAPAGTPTLTVSGRQSTHTGTASTTAHVPGGRGKRLFLAALIWLYDRFQYLWKLAQWVALTPALYFLLLLLSPLRLLARIPAIRPTLVSGINSFMGVVSLHWIAPLQIYLLDYTRSASIRQRFEREVQHFLQDEQCNRVVVIAHSMGTVIAYEGLATCLTTPGAQSSQVMKPVTFLCLGAALRRMWLLTGTDQHRLRRVLPLSVRWLHFWARFDPIAAGPLTESALPRLAHWDDPEVPDPHDAICATLDRCQNLMVANSDSLLSDHTTYWRNLEQVVGPIAQELVAGSPALEQVVATHLAPADAVLLRRWRVAWRSLVALLGGLVAGIGTVELDTRFHLGIGSAIHRFFASGQAENLLIQQATGGHCDTNGCVATLPIAYPPTLVPANPNPLDVLGAALADVGHALGFALAYTSLHLDALLTVLVALVVGSAFVLLVGNLVAMPTPLDFSSAPPLQRSTGGTFVLAVASLVCLFSSYLIVVHGAVLPTSGTLDWGRIATWLLDLGVLGGVAALAAGVINGILDRRWRTLAVLVVTTLVLSVASPAVLTLGALAALVACIASVVRLAIARQWARVGMSSLVTALLVVYTAGTLLPITALIATRPAFVGTSAVSAGFLGVFLFGPLLYALWNEPVAARESGQAVKGKS